MDIRCRKVGVRIRSRFHDIEPDASESFCYFAEMIDNMGDGEDGEQIKQLIKMLMEDEGECEKFEIYTEGELYTGDGKIEIRYREPDMTGMGDTVTSVSFETGNRDLVTITRGGDVYTALVLERGVRHTCAYNTSQLPLLIYTTARRIENSVGENGGELDMIYTVETGMSPPQFNRMTMNVTVSPSQDDYPECDCERCAYDPEAQP